MEDYNSVKINQYELSKAKEAGKKFIKNKTLEIIVEKTKQKFSGNEKMNFYFSGENLENISNKTLAVMISPLAGLAYKDWKMKILFLLTNENFYIVNMNSDLEDLETRVFKLNEIKKVEYYKNKTLNVLNINLEKEILSITVGDGAEKLVLDEFLNSYKGEIINKRYRNKKMIITDIMSYGGIIYALLGILFMIYLYYKIHLK